MDGGFFVEGRSAEPPTDSVVPTTAGPWNGETASTVGLAIAFIDLYIDAIHAKSGELTL